MSMKFGKSDFGFALLWLSVFRFYLPNPQYYYIFQEVASVLLFSMFAAELRKTRPIVCVILFSGSVLFSSVMNLSRIGTYNVLKSLAYALTIMNCFTVVGYYIRKRGVQRLLKTGLLFSGIYMAINVTQVLYGCYTGTIDTFIRNESFFSGGKFSVAYVLLVFLAFLKFACRKMHGQAKYVAHAVFFCCALLNIFICKAIDCSTGMVAIGIYLLFVCLPDRFVQKLDNKYIVLITMFAALVIIFVISIVLSLPFVQHIIVDVLGENLTLTGRLELYSLLTPLLKDAGIFGNGYGSYAATRLGYGGWYNAQNGLSEIILTYGYFGLAAFLLMVFKCTEAKKSYFREWIMLLYTFIVISVVEVPYNAVFIFTLAVYALVRGNSLKRAGVQNE